MVVTVLHRDLLVPEIPTDVDSPSELEEEAGQVRELGISSNTTLPNKFQRIAAVIVLVAFIAIASVCVATNGKTAFASITTDQSQVVSLSHHNYVVNDIHDFHALLHKVTVGHTWPQICVMYNQIIHECTMTNCPASIQALADFKAAHNEHKDSIAAHVFNSAQGAGQACLDALAANPLEPQSGTATSITWTGSDTSTTHSETSTSKVSTTVTSITSITTKTTTTSIATTSITTTSKTTTTSTTLPILAPMKVDVDVVAMAEEADSTIAVMKTLSGQSIAQSSAVQASKIVSGSSGSGGAAGNSSSSDDIADAGLGSLTKDMLTELNDALATQEGVAALTSAMYAINYSAAKYELLSLNNLHTLNSQVPGAEPAVALAVVALYLQNKTELLAAHEAAVAAAWSTMPSGVSADLVDAMKALIEMSHAGPQGLPASDTLGNTSIPAVCLDLANLMIWVQSCVNDTNSDIDAIHAIDENISELAASSPGLSQQTSNFLTNLVTTGYLDNFAIRDVAEAELFHLMPVITTSIHCHLQSSAFSGHRWRALAVLVPTLTWMFV